MSLNKKIAARRVNANECGELHDKTVAIKRVAKVVKGGRRFSFTALVVTGDGRGNVGFGLGKAAEVPDAIRKASEQARKRLVRVPLRGNTIPHDVVGRYGASAIVLKPAAPGTGVIAGSAIRAVADLAGIHDIRTKSVGSNSALNMVQATISGLLSLDHPEVISQLRGISLEDLEYSAY